MKRCLCGLLMLLLMICAPLQARQNNERLIAGRTLAQWVSDIDSENETVRLRAAKTIGQFGEPAVGPLRRMLKHSDPSVRYWAASQLGDLGTTASSAKETLLQLMNEDRWLGVRTAAAYGVSRVSKPAEGLPLLLSSLESNERGLACCAADFLGRIGPPAKAALPALEKAFQRHSQRSSGGDYHVRGAAKNAIRDIRDDREVQIHRRPKKGGAYRTWTDREAQPGPRPTPRSDGRPNILWISCEDISPNLGCYGDEYASTPNLDRLASQGARFTRAFTPAGVCAVVRSGIISGMYPISLGSQHMRSRIVPPSEVHCFTEYLRSVGYFCTNKSKTDYQFNPPVTAWDRQGNNHNDWRERAPGQPFFSVINLTISHESQIRHSEQLHAQILDRLKPEQRHDPELASKHLPPIYPDTPETRTDWAWYADNISCRSSPARVRRVRAGSAR